MVRPIKTTVVGGDLGGTRVFPARVEAGQRAVLSFRVSGPLVELPIEKGQLVQTNQLVARIDPRDFQIALEEAKANFTKADADFKRYQSLYERDAVSIAELDLRRSQRDVAKSRREDAEAALSDTRLVAPFAGNITERYVENHQTVSAQQEIAGLQNFEMLDVVVDVPEQIIARLTPETGGAEVVARFEAAEGREFPLTFREVAAQADPSTQTYEVRLSMPRPEGINILTGMTAEVVARLEAAPSTEDRFLVPSVAVFAGEGDGKRYVWVVAEDLTVHQREVQVGEVSGTGSVEITGGLEAGERIAVAAVTQLREGMKVRLLEETN
jgi:RND family efflux transporter MFP subunit